VVEIFRTSRKFLHGEINFRKYDSAAISINATFIILQ